MMTMVYFDRNRLVDLDRKKRKELDREMRIVGIYSRVVVDFPYHVEGFRSIRDYSLIIHLPYVDH